VDRGGIFVEEKEVSKIRVHTAIWNSAVSITDASITRKADTLSGAISRFRSALLNNTMDTLPQHGKVWVDNNKDNLQPLLKAAFKYSKLKIQLKALDKDHDLVTGAYPQIDLAMEEAQ
jgi:hypothetical protein